MTSPVKDSPVQRLQRVVKHMDFLPSDQIVLHRDGWPGDPNEPPIGEGVTLQDLRDVLAILDQMMAIGRMATDAAADAAALEATVKALRADSGNHEANRVNVEIDDVGLDVDLNSPADVLALILHTHIAELPDGEGGPLRLWFGRPGGQHPGELAVTALMLNPRWCDLGELPAFKVQAIETS